MLRWVIVLLALANAGYFVWTQGYLAPLGMAPVEQTEPERLQAQIKPEALRLLNGPKGQPAPEPVTPPPTEPAPPADPTDTPTIAPNDTPIAAVAATPLPEAPPPPAPEPPPTVCQVAGGYTSAQADALRHALEASGLPRSSWQLNENKTGGRWVVYMGRYSEEQLDKKRTELKELGIAFRTLPAPMGPGLALGTFSSEEAAAQGLQDLSKKGVRTARVVQERAEGSAWTLRLPALTQSQQDIVKALGPSLAGKRLQNCE